MKGIHPNGKATFTAGAAIAAGEFVKFSSGKVVKASAATDVCIGVALDAAAADGDLVPVQLLTSGDTALVKAGDAVCVVEAMKLFNPIKAPTAGKITFLVEHGRQVVKGQVVASIG